MQYSLFIISKYRMKPSFTNEKRGSWPGHQWFQMAVVTTADLEEICSICREDENVDMITSCRHAFHKACFHAWFDANRACPVCRSETPFHDVFFAVEHDDEELLKKCLAQGEGNERDRNGSFPIHVCAERGKLGFVKVLAKKFGCFQETLHTGQTALHLAALKGHLGVVKYLRETGGANIHKRDANGRTAVILAASNGHIKVIKYLVGQGADINAKDQGKWTALTKAAVEGHAILKELLELGAVIPAFDSNQTPQKYVNDPFRLFDALEEGEERGPTVLAAAATSGNLENVKFLVDQTAVQLEEFNCCGFTPLMAAIPHPDIVRYLVERGAELNHKNEHGETALMLAAEDGHLETVRFLAGEAGASLNESPQYGTALSRAAENGHGEVVKVLVEAGADAELGDDQGMTPLMNAVEQGQSQVIKYLGSTGDGSWKRRRDSQGRSALHLAIEMKDLTTVKLLLSLGANPNLPNFTGATPLSLALILFCHEICRCLVEAGASLTPKSLTGLTLLGVAIVTEQPCMVKYFLDTCRLDINEPDMEGNSPLIVAVINGNVTMVKCLLKRGADLNVQNKIGMTALHFAVSLRLTGLVQLLVGKGADYTLRDKNGRTPFTLIF